MIKLNNLNPFGRLCISLGMLPSSYKESLTYEEQLLWMFNYLENTLIPKINEQVEAINSQTDYINNAIESQNDHIDEAIALQNAEIQEQYETLTGLFNQLKDYVDNYFDNLDVQDEINNKLDEMVEDGTFDVIFAQIDEKIGDLSSLTTTDTSSIVGAVNEIDSHTDSNTNAIGTLSNLNTTDKSNLVGAINEVNSKVDSEVGSLSSLTTDSKTNVVSAINEIDSHTDSNTSAIGTLSSLTTTAKNNLVASNNEIVTRSTNAIRKLGVIGSTVYSSSNQTGNYTLESGVNYIGGSIHYNEILENLSLQFNFENTFSLTANTSKLIATLNQPSGRTIQGGHAVILLSNGQACDCIILGSSTIKIYIKSPVSYSAGEITSAYISNLVTFNLLNSVSF